MTRYAHGCWLTGADRVCEDGTKGCSREHELTDAPEPVPTIFCTCQRIYSLSTYVGRHLSPLCQIHNKKMTDPAMVLSVDCTSGGEE